MSAVRRDDENAVYLTDDGEVVETSTATPRSLYDQLRRTVRGQDRALRSFAVAAWRHQQRLRQGAVLITGPTGSGKTLLATSYAKLCDVPIVHVASTALVAEGIRGQTFGDVFLAAYRAAGKDLSRARRSVLVIDEIDKLPSNQYSASIEHSLLTILDGCPWRGFDADKKQGYPRDSFPTAELLVVLLGSFTQVRQHLGRTVGFATGSKASTPSLPDISLTEMLPLDDLRGRISCHIQIDAHTRESLLDILDADDGPLMTLRDALPSWRISLGDELREQLVVEALREELGARYLWTRLATLSEELIFSPPLTAGTYGGIILMGRAA